ncbi:hypothetical protein [Vallitalea sp.]|jgi:hypothetical protein|uniref:hypothetical protein n=2 Tax=Vallitalea sp. TaxID=1882829 RepID=UPI0025DEF36E|nr:hypothetical protein [Vallitalea sp.]MCT4685702.1 hypothetical protein [Vallitalea sp.]
MNKYFLILLFLILGLNANSQSKDIIVRDSVVDMFGYLCRYFYKVDNELYETCVFIPDNENNINEKLYNELVCFRGKMLYKDDIKSYLFNEYIHQLDYYVITPGVINSNSFKSDKVLIYEMLPKRVVHSNVDYSKRNTLLYSRTYLISGKRIKEGIFMVYFGRVKLRGTIFEIKNATKYLNVLDDFMIDIRRGGSPSKLAEYHRSKTNEYLCIDFVY